MSEITGLYIEVKRNKDHYLLPIDSTIVLFCAKLLWEDHYCTKIKFYLVPTKAEALDKGVSAVKLPVSTLQRWADVHEISRTPEVISRCSLPALVTHNALMIHSGLCSTLRALVYLMQTIDSSRNFHEILGFREMSLKSCAEVSVWTKFCEVDIPSLVTMIITKENRVCSRPHFELKHFEEHLSQKAVIHNRGKRKRKLDMLAQKKDDQKYPINQSNSYIGDVSNTKDSETLCEHVYESVRKYQGSEKCKQSIANCVQENTDSGSNISGIIGLEHIFAEGADFTLTDIVLFPCISIIFKFYEDNGDTISDIPLVCSWYNRLVNVPRIKSTSEFLNIPVLTGIVLTGKSTEKSSEASSAAPSSNLFMKSKIKVNTSEAKTVLDRLNTAGVSFVQDDNFIRNDERIAWESLPNHVHPKDALPEKRLDRKLEQLENLALAVKNIAKCGDTIVDFCAGGGHLGILIAHLLPDCNVILVENKQESLRRALERIQNTTLKNINIYQSNLGYFTGGFDIGTCLHACGVATDLVLQKCRAAQASFVVCPCCYGSIQEVNGIVYPRSSLFKDAGIKFQDFLLLARAADTEKKGKEFMNAVDKDRVQSFAEHGYEVHYYTMKPPTCSPKNNLLVGLKR